MNASPAADDLTETRERLSAALGGNEALLHTLDLHSNISVTDSAGRIIDVNDNFCRMSGYSREELLGQPHSVVKSGVQGPEMWTEMWRKISSGEPWRGEICNRAKDGSLLWMDSMIAPIMGRDGLPAIYISIRNDVTAAKETELKLRATEAFLDRAGQTAGVGGWEFDIKTHAIRWSAQMMRIHEVDHAYQPLLTEGLNFYPPRARNKIKKALREAIKSGAGWDLELPLITARGRAIWVRSVGEAQWNKGRPVRLVGSMQDITARKQIENSLVEERARLVSLLAQLQDANARFSIASDSAGIAIWEYEVATKTLVWDDRMYEIYGLARPNGSVTFEQWERALHPDDRAHCLAEVERALRGEAALDMEFRIVKRGWRYPPREGDRAGLARRGRRGGANDRCQHRRQRIEARAGAAFQNVIDAADRPRFGGGNFHHRHRSGLDGQGLQCRRRTALGICQCRRRRQEHAGVGARYG